MDLQAKIAEFILTEICADANLDIREIREDQRLIDSGILDSLGILKLLSFLDEEMNIDISANMVKPENFRTLKTICELVETMAGKDPARDGEQA